MTARVHTDLIASVDEGPNAAISGHHRDSPISAHELADHDAASALVATLRPFLDAAHGTSHAHLADHFVGFGSERHSADTSPDVDTENVTTSHFAPLPFGDTGSAIHDLVMAGGGIADTVTSEASVAASASDASGLLLCGCPACVAARHHGQDSGGPQAGDLSPAAAGTGTGTVTPQSVPAYYIDALINEYDYKWGSGGIGTPVTVTYSFLTSVPGYYDPNAPERVNFAPMNAVQMATVRDALADYSHVANINFVEVSGVGSITFGTANLGPGIGGWAYYPYPGYSGPSDNYVLGDVWITNLYPSYANPGLGSWEYTAFIHEIGHAIGMKHPGNYNAGGGGTGGPYLPAAEDSHQYTVMSYYSGPTYGGVEPITPQLYDVATIQYLYGANTSYHAGDDTYTFAATEEVKTIWDGGGSDTFDASNQSQAVTIDLHPGSFSSIGGINNIAIAFGATIEAAVGSNYDDTLKAGDTGSILKGGAGNDQLIGGAGNDILNGGTGADQLVGGAGNDVLIGGTGGDILSGGGDDDTFIIAANGGADTVTDFIAGASSLDTIDLTAVVSVHSLAQILAIAIQSGADTVINFGGGNSVTLQDVTESNLIASDFDFSPASNHTPTDILLSNHMVAEGSANGTLIGNLSAVDSDQDDTFVYSLIDSAGGKFSLNGVNLLVAGGLHGASYDIDVRVTDSANNFFDKTMTIDISHLSGTTIVGTAGNDQFDADHTPAAQPYATDQSDTIDGAGGNDFINGLGGADTMHGGAGNDVYIVDHPNDVVIEMPGEGIDEIQTYNAQQFLGADVENLTGLSDIGQRLGGNGLGNIILGYTGNDVITGGDGNDTINAGGGDDRVYADNGNDTIDGGFGNDIAYGGAGDDTMYGSAGDDILSGDDGSDTIHSGDGADRVLGGAGNDFIYGDANKDLLFGEAGNDFIDGGADSDIAYGGIGDDSMYGSAGDDIFSGDDGNDTIYGGDGIDQLHGVAGNDFLYGDAGNDLLYGEAGNDFIDGGDGADNMIGGDGDDVYVLDFSQ